MNRSISLSLGATMLLAAGHADANCTWATGAGANGCGDSCADICKNPGVQSAYYDDTDPNFSLMSVSPFNWSAYLQLPTEDRPPLGIGSGTNFYQSIYPDYNTVFPFTWNTWLPRGPVSDSNDPGKIDYFRDSDNTTRAGAYWHEEDNSDPDTLGVGKPSSSQLCYSTALSMAWMWAHNNRASNVQIVANSWADKYFFAGNPTSGAVTPYAGTGAPPNTLVDQTRALNASYTDSIRRCGGGVGGGTTTGGGDGCNTRETLQRITNVATYTHTSPAYGLHTKGDSGSYFMTEDQSLDGCPYGGLNCNMGFRNISYYLYRNNGAHLPYERFFNSGASSPGLTFGDMKWSADHGYSTIMHRNPVNITCDAAVSSPGGADYPPAGKYYQFCHVNETVGGSGHYVAFVGYDNRPGLKKIVYVNPVGAQYTVETNANNTLLDFEMGRFYGSSGDANCNGTKSKPYRIYNWIPESGHAQIGFFVLSGIPGDGYSTTSQCNLVDGNGYKVYDDLDGMRLSGS